MSNSGAGRRPRIAVTLGDRAGVGPELVAKLLADPANLRRADIYVLATVDEMAEAAHEAGTDSHVGPEPAPGSAVAVGIADAGATIPRAKVSAAAGARALGDLRQALAMYDAGQIDSIMFAPMNKTSLHLGGMRENDELRWMANLLDYDGTTSELNFIPDLATSRVTSHMPLKDVASHITTQSVRGAIELLDSVLRDSGIGRPRLAVCALNPHAGENGAYGSEEIEQIAPAVEQSAARGLEVSGPYPCDTIFIAARDGMYDGVVTMYHDQGQIAMKLMGFDRGVTVQGGLPVPIATPSHGTAFAIVGRNVAELGPTQRAFDLAVALGARRISTVG